MIWLDTKIYLFKLICKLENTDKHRGTNELACMWEDQQNSCNSYIIILIAYL